MTTFLFFKFKQETKSDSTEEMVKLAIYNKHMKCQGKPFSINLQMQWALKLALLHLSWSFNFTNINFEFIVPSVRDMFTGALNTWLACLW